MKKNYRKMMDEIHPDPALIRQTKQKMTEVQTPSHHIPFAFVGAAIVCVLVLAGLWPSTSITPEMNGQVTTIYQNSSAQHITQLTQYNASLLTSTDTEKKVGLREFELLSISSLLNQSKNTIYSPLSSNVAIGMLYSGLDGKAKQELSSILQVSQKEMENYAKQIQLTLRQDKGIVMDNSLWFDTSKEVNVDTLQRIANAYRGNSYAIDFTNQAALDELSAYITKQTKNMIQPTYSPKEDLTFKLINVIAVQAKWQDEFIASDHAEPFMLEDGTLIEPDSTIAASIPDPMYEKNPLYERAELALDNGYRFRVVLPDDNIPLSQLLEDPSALEEALYTPIDIQTGARMSIRMPAFTITTDWDLKQFLLDHNVQEIFDRTTSDLHLFGNQLYVGDIQQLATIEVNETGVKVAAKTEVDGITTGIRKITYSLDVNRPFLYALLTPEGDVLFTGTLYDPR